MDVKPFRFGVVGITGTSRQAWIAKAQRAERLGYSTFLVWDHLNEQLAPLIALMAARVASLPTLYIRPDASTSLQAMALRFVNSIQPDDYFKLIGRYVL